MHVVLADGADWLFGECRIPKRDGKKVMDDLWLSTMLSMIGENFDAENEICGAAIRCVQTLVRIPGDPY